ncbi:MAG TPA: 2-hydroxychromene-2-carboxylate isomerase [Burkholderiaceae bacterium]
MKSVQYYFAPQSPFAYLGHARFVELCRARHAKIDPRPFDLGRVFSQSGGLPLAKRAPQRQAYRLLELERWSKQLNVPLNLQPKFFPVSGDAAAKLVIAARMALGADPAVALAGAIMRALWAEDRNIADADTLLAIALECELEGRQLLKSSETPTVEAEYQRYTDDALAGNVFGSPWYIVDGEGFWGQDRLDFVDRALGAPAAKK